MGSRWVLRKTSASITCSTTAKSGRKLLFAYVAGVKLLSSGRDEENVFHVFTHKVADVVEANARARVDAAFPKDGRTGQVLLTLKYRQNTKEAPRWSTDNIQERHLDGLVVGNSA